MWYFYPQWISDRSHTNFPHRSFKRITRNTYSNLHCWKNLLDQIFSWFFFACGWSAVFFYLMVSGAIWMQILFVNIPAQWRLGIMVSSSVGQINEVIFFWFLLMQLKFISNKNITQNRFHTQFICVYSWAPALCPVRTLFSLLFVYFPLERDGGEMYNSLCVHPFDSRVPPAILLISTPRANSLLSTFRCAFKNAHPSFQGKAGSQLDGSCLCTPPQWFRTGTLAHNLSAEFE